MKKLNNNFYSIGSFDPDLRIFDVVMKTDFGTSYNAYLLQDTKHTVIFDGVKERFKDQWLSDIKQITPINKIDILVVHHTEPDHSSSIEHILKLNPNITIYGSIGAINFLKEIISVEFKHVVCKHLDVLDCGANKTKFISAINLHWPDTMFSYIENLETLISCDYFGCHYCYQPLLVSTIKNQKDYLAQLKHYYDNIIGPFDVFSLQALEKIKSLKIKMICPSHGPIIDNKINELMKTYHGWSQTVVVNPKLIVMPYVSCYGYTKAMGDMIASVLRKEHYEVIMHDMVIADKNQVMKDIAKAKCLLFGCPTLLQDALPPIWEILISLNTIIHANKTASAFGSFGWTGEASKNIVERLKQLKFKTIDPLAIRFALNNKEKKQQVIDYANKIVANLK